MLGEDRSIAAFVAPVQLSCWIGQPNSSGNPPELSNAGWDPYGLGDTSHNWWKVESRSVTFNLSGSALNVVWGSPNDDNPLSSNYVSFYSGANGGGGLLGTVLASDLYSNFSGITNTTDPGYAKDPRTSTRYHLRLLEKNVLEHICRGDWMARRR
jgi:hypothetical protein